MAKSSSICQEAGSADQDYCYMKDMELQRRSKSKDLIRKVLARFRLNNLKAGET
jgi:hypothetical protein